MKPRGSNRSKALLRPVQQVLPGVLLGDSLVAIVAASSLATQNHQVVSFVAITVAAAAALGTIALAGVHGFASVLALSPIDPKEPTHIHIARRSRGERA
jgi:hypothetical protein